MKIAWTVLIISALTDFVITAATALTSAMIANGMTIMPSKQIVLLATLGGSVVACRTVQQALRSSASPEFNSKLRKG